MNEAQDEIDRLIAVAVTARALAEEAHKTRVSAEKVEAALEREWRDAQSAVTGHARGRLEQAMIAAGYSVDRRP